MKSDTKLARIAGDLFSASDNQGSGDLYSATCDSQTGTCDLGLETCNLRPATCALQPDLVQAALSRATDCLVSMQNESGFWCGELEGDSILQSEYILLKFIIEQENDPRLPKIANYLRTQQRASDGAWIQYPGGKPDLSATVKAYFALKLLGDSLDAPHMKKARELVLSLGGAERCNTYSKFYLAALGQMHYDSIPVIPPELVLLPKWFYFHLDKVSAWSRTMIMPLAVISSYRPVRQLPAPRSIMELYISHDYVHRPFIEFNKELLSWKNLFLAIDRGLKLLERTKLKPLRRSALQRIEEWILKRTEGQRSDGLGAIFPPMVYIIIALRCLGYSMDNPRVKEAERQLDRLMIEENGVIRFQPCFSPYGTPESRPMRCVKPDLTRHRLPCAGRLNGWWGKNAVISATGRPTSSNRSNPPAGISNSTTPTTPTLMTRRWSQWRSCVPVVRRETPRPSAACGGFWPCRMRMGAGLPLTGRSTGRYWNMCRSRITMPSRTHPALILPDVHSSASAISD